jgi:hypothetical protein
VRGGRLVLGHRVEYGFDLSTYAAFGVEVAEVWIGSSMVLDAM